MITRERRAYKRVKLEFDVKYCSVLPEHTISGNASTRNISCGGVYFESFTAAAIGDLMECRILAPGVIGELRFLSRVVRCEIFSAAMVLTYGIAVEFVKSFDNSDRTLRQILQ